MSKISLIILSFIFPCTALLGVLSDSPRYRYLFSSFFLNILIYSLLFYIFYKIMTKKIKIICWSFFLIVVFSNLVLFFVYFFISSLGSP